jgi:hypothetical protein
MAHRNRVNEAPILTNLRHLNNTTPRFECDVVYLHQQIMFGTPNEVEHFLDNYCNIHGLYATCMFVNFPLQDIDNHSNITALECALTWNTDAQMVRVLYRWGANVHTPNIDGFFTNDRNLPPYRNYLRDYFTMANVENVNNYPPVEGLRERDEFHGVLRELDYIVGEVAAPANWHMPERILDRNINNNNNNNMVIDDNQY